MTWNLSWYAEGRGTVVAPNAVQVQLPDGSTKILKTKNILLATGGYASKLAIEGAEVGGYYY